MKVFLEVVNAEFVAGSLREGVRLYQLEMKKKMREAGSLIRRAWSAKLRSGSPLKSGTGKRAGRKYYGPLAKRVRVRVFTTRLKDVSAVVRYSRPGFYGRFQELGVTKTVERKMARRVRFGDRWVTLGAGSFTYTLPARPVIPGIIKDTREQAVSIMGESFDVFLK